MCKRKQERNGCAGFSKADLDKLVSALAKLPPDQRAKEALTVSAKLVEFAAYESATIIPSDRVGELIIWAAQLDRKSSGLTADQDSDERAIANSVH